jgi:alpha-amylase/alpha-mannosidase (GH57 family)
VSPERYVCIHGHFYQPPRENPWLEAVELQDSAFPYHDWNARITAECYGPNTASRILDREGRIARIVNNYARISFNFGPTLLRWLEESEPECYARVLAADRESRERFSGHGSAIAQAYSHPILPLMNRHDRVTQVVWGKRDFEARFGREPEGMWLPETAVDLETLSILAEQGIRFTILAPHQAKQIRPLEGGDWTDVSGGRIDPRRAYLQRLPEGRSIAVFFYDGPVSRAVAFEKLLANGEGFAGRIASLLDDRDEPQLAHIATDGETYGHHHKHGEMALSYALEHTSSNGHAKLTNYGEFLERFPPRWEVEVLENTSWSCAHGIERWRSDCGCGSGRPGWQQRWRAPLRAALDDLRDRIAPLWEEKARAFLRDPWAARDSYVSVILDRSPANVSRFLEQHAARPLTEQDRVTVLKLLELQRHALLMYTSCGWFFDEVSGLETVQVLQYAACAIQIAEEVLGERFESRFLERLEQAPSNIPAHKNGRATYEKLVRPAVVDLQKVAAHYAVASLFESFGEKTNVYSYLVERHDSRIATAGKAKLALGWARVTHALTGESAELSYGAVHFGDHNITGGIRGYRGFANYKTMIRDVAEAFARADMPEVIRRLDKDFLELGFSLRSLFRDEQRRVLDAVLATSLAEADSVYRSLYEHNAPLLRFLVDLGIPLPRAFREAASLVLHANLRRGFEADPVDLQAVRAVLDEAQKLRLPLDGQVLAYSLQTTLERMAERYAREPGNAELLAQLRAVLELHERLPFDVNLWKVQNVYWDLLLSSPEVKASAGFLELGSALGIRAAA